jgi:5-oxoprolinase (ATP-hydrolysing) subunit A
MRAIDLNADLGEGGSQDAALIALASSVNIACGGHAGDEETMENAVEAALAAGVAIGAHPGYEDREHFGRRAMDLEPAAVAELVSRQVGRLAEIAAGIHHVKPHGALYHQADRDPALAAAVAEGVRRIVPGCGFYVPPAGALAAAGEAAGLAVWAEGFVDRRYQENGMLVPRGEPGAVIGDAEEAIAQALHIACEQRVKTVAGTWFPLPARTLCVHGDSPQAVELLGAVRRALEAAGFTIRA